jgi:flagellar assembly factor FliW
MLNFRQPIFGFDDYQTYALLHDPDMGEEIAWLQSLDDPALCFVIVNPNAVRPDYRPQYPSGMDQLVGEGDCECWLIAVIRDEVAQSTINMKSPVVINWKTGFAAQVMLDGDYPVRQPLLEEAEGTC